MGLPIITCEGTSFAGRVAASLLHAVGLKELIAPSLENYESMAVRFAQDPSLLKSIRQRLGSDRQPLFDTALFARHIEAAYCEMLARHQRGEAPAGFAVRSLAT
jgi:protein O-GlcNAc transferase